jgi:hypothetical protein
MLAQLAAPAGAAAWQAARAATTPAANSFATLLASTLPPGAAPTDDAATARDGAAQAAAALGRLEQATLARLDQLLADEAPLLGRAIELRFDPQDGRIVASEDGFELPRISQLLNDDAEFANQFRELLALREQAAGQAAADALGDAPHSGLLTPLSAIYVLPDGDVASSWQWQAQTSHRSAWVVEAR